MDGRKSDAQQLYRQAKKTEQIMGSNTAAKQSQTKKTVNGQETGTQKEQRSKDRIMAALEKTAQPVPADGEMEKLRESMRSAADISMNAEKLAKVPKVEDKKDHAVNIQNFEKVLEIHGRKWEDAQNRNDEKSKVMQKMGLDDFLLILKNERDERGASYSFNAVIRNLNTCITDSVVVLRYDDLMDAVNNYLADHGTSRWTKKGKDRVKIMEALREKLIAAQHEQIIGRVNKERTRNELEEAEFEPYDMESMRQLLDIMNQSFNQQRYSKSFTRIMNLFTRYRMYIYHAMDDNPAMEFPAYGSTIRALLRDSINEYIQSHKKDSSKIVQGRLEIMGAISDILNTCRDTIDARKKETVDSIIKDDMDSYKDLVKESGNFSGGIKQYKSELDSRTDVRSTALAIWKYFRFSLLNYTGGGQNDPIYPVLEQVKAAFKNSHADKMLGADADDIRDKVQEIRLRRMFVSYRNIAVKEYFDAIKKIEKEKIPDSVFEIIEKKYARKFNDVEKKRISKIYREYKAAHTPEALNYHICEGFYDAQRMSDDLALVSAEFCSDEFGRMKVKVFDSDDHAAVGARNEILTDKVKEGLRSWFSEEGRRINGEITGNKVQKTDDKK